MKGRSIFLNLFSTAKSHGDSEYYVGIAVGGYDDPAAGTVINPTNGATLIKNYSFFPLYPYLMHVVMLPLAILGLNAIATRVLQESLFPY